MDCSNITNKLTLQTSKLNKKTLNLEKKTSKLDKKTSLLNKKICQNQIINNGKNIIKYVDSRAFFSGDEKKTLKIEVDLPTTFNKKEFPGRVYMINFEFNIYYAILGENFEKEHDIEDSKISKFCQQFVLDTTWRYMIEPYDIKAPVICKNIPELFNLMYKEYIDEKNDKLIYEFFLEPNRYLVIDNELKLSSVFPSQQSSDGVKINYSLN